MATPSSPATPPPQNQPEPSSPSPTSTPPNPNSAKPMQSSSPPRKPQSLPWTKQETVNLIQAYQEKWYSLKRGQLKAGHWEEVAVTVAARCGYDEPSKTATQCRHKIEKLRQRYRAEKQKPNPNWEYFDVMDRLDRGPLPISAQPIAMVQYNRSGDDDCYDYEHDEHDSAEVSEAKYNNRCINSSRKNKSKSVNRIAREPENRTKATMDRKLNGVGEKVSEFLQKPVIQRRKERFERYEREDEEEEEEGGSERDLAFELAAEIKEFAERLVKMEHKKMEIIKETETCRMEMENKRMKKIAESQRKIVDSIGRAFSSHKKMKIAPQDV
ncbi:hypothetical protein NMG60_11034527 [Bertholletia excelsa]